MSMEYIFIEQYFILLYRDVYITDIGSDKIS